jgi:hypothetical protein
MKMAKSTTKKLSVEIDVEKIRRFTENELSRLVNQSLPFCYQIGSNLLIVGNKYKIQKFNDKCWQVTENDQQIFDFFTRKDAIFYCIAMHKKDYVLAKEIKEGDDLLSRLDFEAILYRHRFKKAKEANDDWDLQLYSSKYTETMSRIEQTKQQLKKSQNLAKYIKV